LQTLIFGIRSETGIWQAKSGIWLDTGTGYEKGWIIRPAGYPVHRAQLPEQWKTN
jgi:hypothetical protein